MMCRFHCKICIVESSVTDNLRGGIVPCRVMKYLIKQLIINYLGLFGAIPQNHKSNFKRNRFFWDDESTQGENKICGGLRLLSKMEDSSFITIHLIILLIVWPTIIKYDKVPNLGGIIVTQHLINFIDDLV